MNPYADIQVPTFAEVVRRSAGTRGEAIALRFGDRSWTYEALDRFSNRIANTLLREGLEPGDRVAWLGRNSDALILLALAASKAGMIFVPINWRLAPLEIEHIMSDAGAALLFCETTDEPTATGDRRTLPAGMLLDEQWLSKDEGDCGVPNDARETVLMIYTSGTTGMPKGVMLSHRSLFGTSMLRRSAAVEWDDWSSDDVTLIPIPLAHIAGFGMAVRTLFFGGEAIIQTTFEPGLVLDAIEHQRVSKIGLVPTAMKMVIDHPRSGEIDYGRIRTIIYGAAPITVDLLREAIAVFGCQFAQSYGMSETSGTCVALPPEDHDVNGTPRMRAAGKPLPGNQLRILDDEGDDLPLGEIGEITVRTISVMNGYWGMPQATAKVLDADGWYRSGDAGYLDEDGYLFIKDRVKDMIVSGAENIYPAEVENAIADHPDVGQVAVIGVPDPHWGEAVKAVIVPRSGSTVDTASVIAWARERIAAYKVPKTIEIVDALPCNASGKIQKHELRKLYAARSV